MLWINCRLLHPLIGGDRLRTFHMLRHLKEDFDITYLCPFTRQDTSEAIEGAGNYCDTVVAVPHDYPARGTLRFHVEVVWNCFFGRLPYMASKYLSAKLQQWLREHLAVGEFDIVVCDYLVSFAHVSALGEIPSTPPVVVFQHNVESLIWRRHAEAATAPWKRWVYRREQQLVERMENHCSRAAAGQITVSPEETQYFREQRGMTNILGEVPTGVDASYFTPSADLEPHTLAFLGSMDWEANVIAVRDFLDKSYPVIKARVPGARLLIIGRNPPPEIVEAARRDSSIEVTGTVPDVRPYLSRASVMVLPLSVGGGTRVKVFEGMAAGLAVVSTPVGVEGLPVVHDRHALIAEAGPAFTDAAVAVLLDPALRTRLAEEARSWVKERFSWAAAASRFRDLCRPLIPKT